MKNVALLLPGISRSAKLCYESLKNNILDIYNVDIFIHTYEQSNISVDERHVEHENSYEELINLFNPKEIVVEDYFKIRPKLKEKLNNISSITAVHPMRCVSSFYKIEKCFNLLEKYNINKYDFFIRSRMDILYEEKLFFNIIKSGEVYIPKPSTKKTVFENGYYKSYSGDYQKDFVMDHFAIGDFKAMHAYCSAYKNIDNLCYNNKFSLHPELITRQNIINKKININRFKFDYSLYRKPVV
jgi:hypothetical protein